MKSHKCPTCGAPLLFDFNNNGFPLKREVKRFIDDLEVEGRSYAYIRNLRQRTRDYIVPFFECMDIRAIRTFHVDAFYHDLLKKRLSSKTVKHILDTLRAFLFRAFKVEKIEKMPFFPEFDIKPARKKAWIDTETQGRVIAFIPAEDRLIIRVMCETGIRSGEACAVQKQDIRDGGVMVCHALDERRMLKGTKTGRSVFRPLSVSTYQELHERAAFLRSGEEYAFRHRGELYSSKLLYKTWARACVKAGVKISLQQGSRHSRVSQLRQELEYKMRDVLRQELGHTSYATTMRHYALGEDRRVGSGENAGA